MRTANARFELVETLFGRVRWGVLRALAGAAGAGLGVREIARSAAASPGTVHRELDALARGGIVRRRREGKQRLHSLDRHHPLFAGLQQLAAGAAPAPRARPEPDAAEVLATRLAAALAPEKNIRLALLFGSAVTGALHDNSDIDVAIASRAPLDPKARRRIVERVASVVGRPVDLVDLLVTGEALAGRVLREGRLIIQRDRSLRGTLLARQLTDHADFGGLRDRLLAERRRRWIAG
jgi:predicted nucleotidyltransferase